MHFESDKSKGLAKLNLKYQFDISCIFSWMLKHFIYFLIYVLMMPCFYLAVLGIKNLKDANIAAIVFYCISFYLFLFTMKLFQFVLLLLLLFQL